MRLFHGLHRRQISSNAPPNTPYLQIGEHKYGKPVLDPRDALRRRTVRGAEDQPDLDGLDDAFPTSALACRSTCWWCGRTPARPISITASRPANPISTICVRAGRRRCARAHQNIPRPPYKSENKNLKARKQWPTQQNRIAIVTGAGHRRRTRGIAGADECRLHRGARRGGAWRCWRRPRKLGDKCRQEPVRVRRHDQPGLDCGPVRQGDGDLRPGSTFSSTMPAWAPLPSISRI